MPRLLAAMLVLMLSTSAATATGTAGAAISNLRLGVLDLTPADGRAAGFDLAAVQASLYASLYSDTVNYSGGGDQAPHTPASVTLMLGNTSASARTNGALGDVASQAVASPDLYWYGYAGASSYQALQLLLHPYSVLTVSGHLWTHASRADDGSYYETVGMAAVAIGDENGYTHTEYVRQSVSYADWPASMTVDEDFTLAFANGGAEAMAVSVYLQAWTDARVLVPVPEPATPAMLCAGTLLLAAVRICRRRRMPVR